LGKLVQFVKIKNKQIHKTLINLGQFTNEIDPRKGNHIVEFVSAGPKNYAYKTDFNITESIVKGITFNHLTSLAINFESIKKIVESKPEERESITVPQFMFIRNKKTWLIKTQVKEKTYRHV
jgi:hypothetical protein